MPLSPNMRAALFMTVSMAGSTINDGVTKYMSEVMNMGQVQFLRGAFATLFVAVLAWHQGAFGNLRLTLHPMVLIRVVGEVLAPDDLLPRARTLGEQLAGLPALTLRHTRAVLVRELRRRMADELAFGLAHEGLAMLCLSDR